MSKITIDSDLLEQALEAFRQIAWSNDSEWQADCANESALKLRAALEQPDIEIPASVPEGWRLVPVEPTDSQIRAAQDTWWHACNSEMYWDQIYAAMLAAAPQPPVVEQPQDHSEQRLDMVPADWKLVPVEPTSEMIAAGNESMQYSIAELPAFTCYNAMLRAAPQPPTLEQPQVEQEPFTVLVRKHSWLANQWEAAPRGFPDYGKQWADERVNVYTHPQPPRQPLTDEQITELADAHMEAFAQFVGAGEVWFEGEKEFARAIEAAHGITGEQA